MPEATKVKPETHFKFLDSARGIAALMVFAGHHFSTFLQNRPKARYFNFIFNGGDAVSFFFVLSGFVLSYKYIVLNKPLDIRHFYITRIFRIFPAYFVIVFANAFNGQFPDLSVHKLHEVFILDKTNFWEEALLLRYHNYYFYPGWTLTIEILASFLIPYYIALALINKRFVPFLILTTLIIGNDIYFSYTFLFGMILSCNLSSVTDVSFEQTKWWKYRFPIMVLAIILFSLRPIDQIFPFGHNYDYFTHFLGINLTTFSSLSCFVFLAAILHSRKTQKFLERRLLLFLGKISYSIYLVHTLVIGLLYRHLTPEISAHQLTPINFALITVVCVAGVLTLATITYYCIELPSIRIGKRIAGAMKPSLVIRRVPA
jgi:peptidoglycan/LPS O-acetylase OafA/YrhL